MSCPLAAWYYFKKTMKEESELQAGIVKWFREKYPDYLLFSVPNEATYTKAFYYRYLGCLSGAPDLIMVLPEKVIFLELKSAIGYLSANQVTFMTKAEALGMQYYVIRDLADLKTVLRNNLYVDQWVDL